MQVLRIDAIQLDDLRRTSEAAHDSNGRGGDSGQPCEVPDDRLVRLAVHRGRGDMQLPTVAVSTREFGLARAGADLKRESGFHLLLSSAIRCAHANRSLRPPDGAPAPRTKAHHPASRGSIRLNIELRRSPYSVAG